MKTVDEELEELPAIVENNDEPIQEKDMDCSWFYDNYSDDCPIYPATPIANI